MRKYFFGNPGANGNTATMVAEFVKGDAEAGHEVETIHLLLFEIGEYCTVGQKCDYILLLKTESPTKP